MQYNIDIHVKYENNTEYREAFKNSNLITDFSINRDDNNTSSHIFLSLVFQLN